MTAYGGWVHRFVACFGLPAVDFAADFWTSSGQVCRDLLLDGIHPNGEGHLKKAERLASTLLIWARVRYPTPHTINFTNNL